MTRESSREWQLGYQQVAEARAPGTGATTAPSRVSGSGGQPRCRTGPAERPTTSGGRRLRRRRLASNVLECRLVKGRNACSHSKGSEIRAGQ